MSKLKVYLDTSVISVRAITNLKGHNPIEILNPSVLLESEDCI